MKRATIVEVKREKTPVDFNPRPREEGDEGAKFILSTFAISIHALVKRATVADIVVILGRNISIHALVKRATPNYRLKFRHN